MKLTPTEGLIMEVLAARFRLGENLWTFESRNKKALDSLESKGLIWGMHGVVENTLRAGLTDKGKKKFLSTKYPIPVSRGEKKLREWIETLPLPIRNAWMGWIDSEDE